MKLKFILLIFTVIIFSGFLFAGTPGGNIPTSSTVFDVDILIPNPYFGMIVADASNLANPNSVSTTSIQNNAVTLSKISASLPGAGKFLRINAAANALEWATVDGSGGGGTGNGITYTAASPINILNNVIGLMDGGITSSKLADNSVISSKLADESVISSKLSNNSVTSQKLADSSVTNNKIGTAAVSKEKIAVKSVDYARLEVYPLDKCPANGASLIYKSASAGLPDRLEWSNYVTCGASVSVGAISSTVTPNYFFAPFNSCVKSVTHTVSPVTCTGESCVEEWSLLRSGGSDSVTNNLSNVTNTSRSVTFNASENNIYTSSYDLKYTLSQPSTGLTQTVSRNNFSSISGEEASCKPIVNSVNYSDNTNYAGCIISYDVSAVASCVGTCSYIFYIGDIPLPYTYGTFSGNNKIVSAQIPLSEIMSKPNPKFKAKITNITPIALAGLNVFSNEMTIPFTYPQIIGNDECFIN